jgi:hypothetical protein
MNIERESEPFTHAHAHAREICVSFVYSAWPAVGGAALGLSYVPPAADGGWRGRIISKSGIPLAGRKIKTLH